MKAFSLPGVVLYGGAFDPPHEGHAAIAKKIAGLPGVEKLVVVPSGPRTDKAYKTTEAHRRKILELFVEDLAEKRIVLDTDFLDLPELGDTTTLGMEAHYSQKFGVRPAQVFGADVVPNMKVWDPNGNVERSVPKILVIRDGKVPDTSELANFLLVDPEIPERLRPLSSTEIRERIRRKIYEGLTPKVARYVETAFAYAG